MKLKSNKEMDKDGEKIVTSLIVYTIERIIANLKSERKKTTKKWFTILTT